MNFGIYTGTLLLGSSTGRVTCAGGWTVSLNAGTSAGGSETVRKMTGPAGATLNYQVFTDSQRTNNWGNTTGNELTGSGNTNITFYSQIGAGQYLAPGTYTDTLGTGSTTFTVTAIVQATCIISAGNLSFGTYTGAQNDATAALSITCTNTTPYYVNLDNGVNVACCFQNRMTGPGGITLNYTNYLNSGRSIRWGNTVNNDGVGGTGSGGVQALTVYSRIFGGQYVTPGRYADTVVATVTY